jgi:hypothetical protein
MLWLEKECESMESRVLEMMEHDKNGEMHIRAHTLTIYPVKCVITPWQHKENKICSALTPTLTSLTLLLSPAHLPPTPYSLTVQSFVWVSAALFSLMIALEQIKFGW